MKKFPKDVRIEIGAALADAQMGGKSPKAKPLRGYKGSGVLEIVENFDTDTYRGVYTVRFKGMVYVLHAFQKKSTHGIETPKKELELIERRLKWAEEDYRRREEGK